MQIAHRKLRERLAALMQKGLECADCSDELKAMFKEWLENQNSAEVTNRLYEPMVAAMEKCGCDTCKAILAEKDAVATPARLSSLRKIISLNAASGSSAVTVLPMISVMADSTTSSLPAKMSTSSCSIPRCTPTPVVRHPKQRRSAQSLSSLLWVSAFVRKTLV